MNKINRKPFARRVVSNIGSSELPARKFVVQALTKDREGWHCKYNIIGNRAVGTLFDPEGYICRTNFNVGINAGLFSVDIGASSGAKIKFDNFARELLK